MNNPANDTNYTVQVRMSDGSIKTTDEWFSKGVAQRIANKAIEFRKTVANSKVTAIEVVDFDGNQVSVVKF